MAAAMCPSMAQLCARQQSFLQRLLVSHARSYAASTAHHVQNSAEVMVTTASGDNILIPKRKKRDSLSILRALSASVGHDESAPHYQYTDDPYLIPRGFGQKRLYSYSKSSGRKAARYIVNEYWAVFNKSTAIPHIPTYMPEQINYIQKEVTEEALLERIGMKRVKDAIELYRQIKRDGGEISSEVCHQMLDLCSVYNSDEPSMDLTAEEFFFKKNLGLEPDKRDTTRNKWHTDNFAERIFHDLQEKDSRAYCSLICGMAKYMETEKSFALHDEMTAAGMPVDTKTYHALISIASFHAAYGEEKLKLINKLLVNMEKENLQPTIVTFNAVLLALTRVSRYHQTPPYVYSVMQEMKNLGIEPCLASWLHIIKIFYPDDANDHLILHKIVDHLEGKEFDWQDPNDNEFFAFVMMKCCVNLKDLDYAYKIDALASTGQNRAFIGDAHKEGMYYGHFFRLICTFETIDKIMEYYGKVMFSFWTPTFKIYHELLGAIDLHDGFQHIPQIWADIMYFDYARSEELVFHVVSLMVKKKQAPELQKTFVDIVQSLMHLWKEDDTKEFGRRLTLSAGMIGDMLLISLNADDRFDNAWDILMTYKENDRKFSGLPSVESISSVLEKCVELKDTKKAIETLELMSHLCLSNRDEAVSLICDKLKLNESQTNHVKSLAL